MLDAIKRRLYEHLTHRRGQEKIHQLRRHLQTPDPIVLVHQMGRAGSMTTVGTLERADLGMPVLHSHSLNPRNIQRRVTYFAGRRCAENRLCRDRPRGVAHLRHLQWLSHGSG